MKVLPCAEFSADFPDDMIEVDDEIVQFGGRHAAEAIAELLRRMGYKVSAPEHQAEHGWDFTVTTKACGVWVQITDFRKGNFILCSGVPALFLFRDGNKRWHAEVLERLNEGLSTDPRFMRIRWFTNNELLSGRPGAPGPIVDA